MRARPAVYARVPCNFPVVKHYYIRADRTTHGNERGFE